MLLVASVLRLAGNILTGWGLLLVLESLTRFRFHLGLLELGDGGGPQYFLLIFMPAHIFAWLGLFLASLWTLVLDGCLRPDSHYCPLPGLSSFDSVRFS